MTNNTQDTKVVTGKVRLSYANIWEPAAIGNQEPKYSVALLIPKSDKDTIAKIKAAIEAAKQQGVATKWGGKVPPKCDTTIHDGDGEKPNGGEYGEECQGHYVLNSNSKQKPGIVDKNVNPILDKTEVYSGCYARVSVGFYAYDSNGKKGIGCGLQNIQKLADGEPFGGRSRAEDDFEAIEDNNDDFLS